MLTTTATGVGRVAHAPPRILVEWFPSKRHDPHPADDRRQGASDRRSPRLDIELPATLVGGVRSRVTLVDLSMSGCLVQCERASIRARSSTCVSTSRLALHREGGCRVERRRHVEPGRGAALPRRPRVPEPGGTRAGRVAAPSWRQRGGGGVRTRPLTDVSQRLAGAPGGGVGALGRRAVLGLLRRLLRGGERPRPPGRSRAVSCTTGRAPVAYCYYMLDSGRAIVGSLFAATAVARPGIEEELLDCGARRGAQRSRATTAWSARRCSRPRRRRTALRARRLPQPRAPLPGAGPAAAGRDAGDMGFGCGRCGETTSLPGPA